MNGWLVEVQEAGSDEWVPYVETDSLAHAEDRARFAAYEGGFEMARVIEREVILLVAPTNQEQQ